MLDLHGFQRIAEAVGEQANIFPRQFAAIRSDPVVVGQAETEVLHEQALRGGDTFLLQKCGNVALTDRDGTAQPPFAQTVRALTAAERQQFRICAGRDFEDSAGQIVELQRCNNIVFVHQLIALFCHTRHLPAFVGLSISQLGVQIHPNCAYFVISLCVFSLVGTRGSTPDSFSRKD